jgi:hypothetical protein
MPPIDGEGLAGRQKGPVACLELWPLERGGADRPPGAIAQGEAVLPIDLGRGEVDVLGSHSRITRITTRWAARATS